MWPKVISKVGTKVGRFGQKWADLLEMGGFVHGKLPGFSQENVINLL